MEYKHKEIGWFVIAMMSLSVFLLIAGYLTIVNFDETILLIIASFLFIITLLFYKLTVRISQSAIQLIYGVGIIRINLNIDQLESVEVTRTPWYYGLGIRFSPKGMIYNIQSLNAVKINLSKNGKSKTLFIGSPHPEAVIRAIAENATNEDI